MFELGLDRKDIQPRDSVAEDWEKRLDSSDLDQTIRGIEFN